ncbi:MAG: bifunctional diaminohydroxyphosphoribosylaminopyrimidine deaminase/5-amino-6-(5-phosphoribosylamino)uracil reductase RibD [Gemmatimonadaceae bacterium]
MNVRADVVHERQEADRSFMDRALVLAERGWGQTAPNPMVGAVVVRDGAVVGEGFHARFGEAHAEVVALRAAGARAKGATLYVSLEPCAHTGKTPPCTDTIVAAGIGRVVYAMADPNPVAGGGAKRLAAAGIAVTGGVGEAAARELNAAFVHALTADRPWVTLKMAVTIDCAIADGTATTSWITNDSTKRFVHRLRAGHDAVAVGMSTVRIDDPQLTVRESEAPRVAPMRVVFSRTGRLPLTSTLARSAREVPVIVVGHDLDSSYAMALNDLGVEIIEATSLADALRALRRHGVQSLLVEGGAVLAGALLAEQLVDRLLLIQAPVIFGAGALGAFSAAPAVRGTAARRWRVVRREALDDDLLSVYAPAEGEGR